MIKIILKSTLTALHETELQAALRCVDLDSCNLCHANVHSITVRQRVERLQREIEAVAGMVDRSHDDRLPGVVVRELPACPTVRRAKPGNDGRTADVRERWEGAEGRELRGQIRAGNNVCACTGVVVGLVE